MWLSVPMMLLKRVLRSFSASPGGRAATLSNITLSAQALYWASILTVCVSIMWKISRCRDERSFLEIFRFTHDQRRSRAVERIANGAEQLRFADGDLLVRQNAGRAGDDDRARDGRDGLIEPLQRRVELGERAFLAGRQAVGVVAADVAAHACIESPGGLVGFRLAFPGQ